MRYGFCTGFATQPLFTIDGGLEAKVGTWEYDYVEYPVMGIAALSEKDFAALQIRIRETGLGCDSMCNLLPASVPVTGPQADAEQLCCYLDTAFARAACLGVKKLVFGSAGARPRGGQTKSETDRQFLAALGIMEEYAFRYQIPVLIEAIRRGEADYINTLAEAAEIASEARKAGYHHIGLMADLYHMMCNEEAVSDLERFLPMIGHIHLCEADRALPDQSFSPYLKNALAVLRSGEYEGTISFESAPPKTEEQARRARILLENAMTA